MLKRIFIPIGVVTAISMLLFSSCKPDEPVVPNEEEVINQLVVTLTNETTNEVSTITYSDSDGDGPAVGVQTNQGAIKANSNYSVSLRLYNTLANPDIEITPEVLEEGVDHQFYFVPGSPSLTIAYDDMDDNGAPIGLKTVWTTAATPGVAPLRVVLRHEPDKSVGSITDPSQVGGATDVDIDLSVNIQ